MLIRWRFIRKAKPRLGGYADQYKLCYAPIPMTTYLHIGGLIAAGFDPSGSYLLTVTHSGRGVFSTRTWERVARDYDLAYPENGKSIGIGPIDGQTIHVTEMNFETELFAVTSPDGRIRLHCESSGIAVESTGT